MEFQHYECYYCHCCNERDLEKMCAFDMVIPTKPCLGFDPSSNNETRDLTSALILRELHRKHPPPLRWRIAAQSCLTQSCISTHADLVRARELTLTPNPNPLSFLRPTINHIPTLICPLPLTTASAISRALSSILRATLDVGTPIHSDSSLCAPSNPPRTYAYTPTSPFPLPIPLWGVHFQDGFLDDYF